MRVLVCGDREWDDYEAIKTRLAKFPKDTVIIEGDCRGADRLAGQAAFELGLKYVAYPADWEGLGLSAGPMRNRQMLLEGQPDLVLWFHNDIFNSKGTWDMVTLAKRAGVQVEPEL